MRDDAAAQGNSAVAGGSAEIANAGNSGAGNGGETSEGGGGGVVDAWVMVVLALALAGTVAMAAWHRFAGRSSLR